MSAFTPQPAGVSYSPVSGGIVRGSRTEADRILLDRMDRPGRKANEAKSGRRARDNSKLDEKHFQACSTSASGSKSIEAPQKNYTTHPELAATARNKLLMKHLPQVHSIARRIRERLPANIQLEDLVHAGVLGLIEAFERYDPGKQVEFKSFAGFRIRGAILDSLRELDWAPRALRRNGRDVERARHTLQNTLGRSPTESELAAEMKMDLRRLQTLLSRLSGASVYSLQQESQAEEFGQEERGATRVMASTDDPFVSCLRGEIRRLLARAIGELPPRERRVLALYYYGGRTMKEVARALGVCEARVSQIHSAALIPLRSRMAELLDREV